jgi:hypothetical protein
LRAAARAADARRRSVAIGIMQASGSLGHALGALMAGGLIASGWPADLLGGPVGAAGIVSATVAIVGGTVSDVVSRALERRVA